MRSSDAREAPAAAAGIRPFVANTFSDSLRLRMERGLTVHQSARHDPPLPQSHGASLSASRREALRRKFKLSTEHATDGVALEWRRVLRNFNRAQDGSLKMNEFVDAVRSGDVPSSRGIIFWSERELEELWLAVKDENASLGAGVEIEELVHFLCSSSAGQQQPAPPAQQETLEDSLVDDNSPGFRRPTYMPEEILVRSSRALSQEPRSAGITSATAKRRAERSASAGPVRRAPSASSSRSHERGEQTNVRVRGSGGAYSYSRGRGLSPLASSPGSVASRRSMATSPLSSSREAGAAIHTSAESARHVEQLERQLEQYQEHIRLLNQLQQETEGHVSDLRERNEQYVSDLEQAGAGAAKAAARAKQLEDEMRGTRDETQRMLMSLATEEREKERALEEAAAARAATAREVERVSHCQQRIDDLTVLKSELSHERRELSSKVDTLKDELQEARLALQLECEARLRAEKDLADERAGASQLKWGQDELEQKAAMLQSQLASGERESKAMRDANSELKRRLEAVENQLEVNRIRLEGAEGSLHSNRAQKEELEKRLDAVAASRAELESQLQASQERYGAAAGELQEASAAVEALKGEVARVQAGLRHAEEGEQRAICRVEALEQAQEVTMQELRVREDERREAVESAHTVKRQLQPQLAEAEARLKTEAQRNAELEGKVAGLQGQLTALGDDRDRVSAELELSRQAARELKREMESLMENLAKQRASNIEVVKENRNLLVELRTQEERNMGLLQMVSTEEDARKRLQLRLDACHHDLEAAKQGWSTLQQLTGVSLGGRRQEGSGDESQGVHASSNGSQAEDDSEAVLRRWRSQKGARLTAGAGISLDRAEWQGRPWGVSSVKRPLDVTHANGSNGPTCRLAEPISGTGSGRLAHMASGALAASGYLPQGSPSDAPGAAGGRGQ